MKLKTFVPAILAGVLGLGAAYFVRNMMMKSKTTVVVQPKTVQAIVAQRSLITGQEVTADDITVATVPAPEKPGEIITNPGDVLGRVLSAPVVPGQVIATASIAARGVSPTLPSLVPAGMRAITLVVDETNSFSGMLVPGCHVDIMGTFVNGKESATRTLIKNVLVQAVGQRLSSARSEDGKEPPPFHTATLIVTPHEAAMLDLTSSSAKMRFVLKGFAKPTDAEPDTGSASIAELKGNREDEAPTTPSVAPTAIASDTNSTPTTQPATTLAELTTTRHTVELINGPGSAPTRLTFDIPAPAAQVDTAGQFDKVLPDSDAEPRD
jgi:pilus assembly protein CpaB